MSDAKGAMRVLVSTDAVGGVWTYALDLARGLGRLGVETLLACTGPAPDPARRAAAASIAGTTLLDPGIGLDWLAPDPAGLHAAAHRLAELAGDHAVAIAHLNAPALAVARYAMPTLAVSHSCLGTWWQAIRGGPLPPDFAWRDALTGEGLCRADRAVAPSHAHAQATLRAHRLPVMPAIVHNGRTPLVPDAACAPAAVFTAGRLWDAGKDVATLDAAAASLAVPFEAAGPLVGPQGEAIAPRHLRCPGPLGEAALGERLAARPVFASAARYEPFGLAVLEAAQAGCALVLADIPVFRELWDGAAAFVAPGDAPGFAAAIEALLADPTARAAAGEAARARAARYTVAAMAQRTAAIYRMLVAERRAAA